MRVLMSTQSTAGNIFTEIIIRGKKHRATSLVDNAQTHNAHNAQTHNAHNAQTHNSGI